MFINTFFLSRIEEGQEKDSISYNCYLIRQPVLAPYGNINLQSH